MSIQVNDIVRIEMQPHGDDYYYETKRHIVGDSLLVVLDIEDNGTKHHDIHVRRIRDSETFYICSCVIGKASARCPFG